MQVHYASGQLPILFGGWRILLILAFSTRRIVKRPMFHIALSALHYRATHAGIPAPAILRGVAFGEVEIGIRHSQVCSYAAETKLAVGLFEGERVSGWSLLPIQEPF